MQIIPKGAKVRVNDGVFSGVDALAANNGATLTVSYNKNDPKLGSSGETQAFATANGGMVYLEASQYTVK